MPRIVIDARVINSTTGRYVERLLHHLQQLDHDNEYIVLIPTADKKYWQPTASNFSVELCDIKNYSIAEQTKMLRLLRRLQPDLVHFCMPQQPIFYRGRAVTTFHDLTLIRTYNEDKNWLIFKFKQQIGKLVFLVAAKKSTEIITPTNYTKKDLMDFASIPSSKITVTYEAADITKSSPRNPNFSFKDYLLYVGKHSTYKNVRRLAEAHQKLLIKYPDLWLVLANTKDKAVKMNEEYFTSKNYKNIFFFGRADDRDLSWLYANTRAYIFPSLMEGFGLPGLEAMGFEAPVISSNATCLPEVYGRGAIYFNPLNIDDMVIKINRILSDRTFRTNLIKLGKEQHKKYSWQNLATRTLAVYQKALRG